MAAFICDLPHITEQQHLREVVILTKCDEVYSDRRETVCNLLCVSRCIGENMHEYKNSYHNGYEHTFGLVCAVH